ncbi:sialomucin core protein 24-like [Mugil cephalus]|uniref:sialomucin core protein 24-like n=1 Tax=Mugil cephalus TaxID=48193 RepID=UPI001FB5C6E7|nr:sialomucin core protein 24-like [Mugil cephalus]XP_047439865.1 sialomucin core protein 24-like [Mugil cephalus]
MDTKSAGLACCILAFTCAMGQTQNGISTITPPSATSDSNLTLVTTVPTSSNSTVSVTSDMTENSTQYTSTTTDGGLLSNTTVVTAESTSQPETSLSTTTSTPHTNSTSLTSLTTPSAPTPTFTNATVPTVSSTVGNISTPDSPVTATENSSHPVNTTSGSVSTTKPGLGLNISEKYITIVLSATLGVFIVTMVMFMLHKYKQKIQFLHQPLNNTDDRGDTFVADDDVLVISGGLYDGHPIYDNIPSAPENQSQFRLEFL